MLEGETILCLSPSSWFSLWRNRQQIMSRLARRNVVLFVEPQRNPQYSFLVNLKCKACNFRRVHVKQVDRRLYVVDVPPALPFSATLSGWIGPWLPKQVSRVNNAVLLRSVSQAIRYVGCDKPILWLYLPYHGRLVGHFGEKLVCYHIYDELADYPSNRIIKTFFEHCDRELCKKVDVIFASSLAQTLRRRLFNPHTYFVPNAADFTHFQKALDPNLELPLNVRDIPQPRIVYCGFLGFQIDVGLLLKIATAQRDWRLLLVGPDRLKHDKVYQTLRQCKNVYFLGEKPLQELPAYLRACDVAIMPYDLSTHVLTSYPLKLHEYLAAGKPIVSVNMPELEAFKDVIYISKSGGDFLSNIELALEEDTPEKVQKRVEVARRNTWDDRVEEMSRFIIKRLSEKSCGIAI